MLNIVPPMCGYVWLGTLPEQYCVRRIWKSSIWLGLHRCTIRVNMDNVMSHSRSWWVTLLPVLPPPPPPPITIRLLLGVDHNTVWRWSIHILCGRLWKRQWWSEPETNSKKRHWTCACCRNVMNDQMDLDVDCLRLLFSCYPFCFLVLASPKMSPGEVARNADAVGSWTGEMESEEEEKNCDEWFL